MSFPILGGNNLSLGNKLLSWVIVCSFPLLSFSTMEGSNDHIQSNTII